MKTAVRQIISDIKEYARSLDVPSNHIYKDNEMLILSCFMKAVEICENKLAMEKSNMIGLLQWMNKVASETPMRLETDLDDIVEQYYNETYDRAADTKQPD